MSSVSGYLPAIQYMCKMCHDLAGRNASAVEWQPAYMYNQNLDDMWAEYLRDDPDMVCFSVYLWNANATHQLAQRIREQHPHKTLILGGPDVQWRTHQQYLLDHPWYDYIVYGDPEHAFTRLLDHVIDGQDDPATIPNLIYLQDGSAIKTRHEVYRGELYHSHSPWLHCRDWVVRDSQRTWNMGLQPNAAWESDRGCPYDCSFCDWQMGLHHKVTRKKYDVLEEIQMFAELGIYINFANANFGMFQDDQQAMEKIWQLMSSGEYPRFSHADPSWAKLHKKQVHDIICQQHKYFGFVSVKPSLQTITPHVLENIDRPSIPWQEYKEMIVDLRQRYDQVHFYPQLIAGLPGETRESWDNNMIEFIGLAPLSSIICFHWHMLPNSPAYLSGYQERHQLKVLPSVIPYEDSHKVSAVSEGDSVADMLMASYNNPQPLSYACDIVWGSNSHDIDDALYMLIAAGMMIPMQQRTGADPARMRSTYRALRTPMWDRARRDGDLFRAQHERLGRMPAYVLHDGRVFQYFEAWNKPFSMELLLNRGASRP
jgi:tRNA A37 methylthiotransferase MiaB